MLKTISNSKLFKLNQFGVAHLLYPILGLAVVAVIAGAGFYVYQQNKSGAGSTMKVPVTVIARTPDCRSKISINYSAFSNKDNPTKKSISYRKKSGIKHSGDCSETTDKGVFMTKYNYTFHVPKKAKYFPGYEVCTISPQGKHYVMKKTDDLEPSTVFPNCAHNLEFFKDARPGYTVRAIISKGR